MADGVLIVGWSVSVACLLDADSHQMHSVQVRHMTSTPRAAPTEMYSSISAGWDIFKYPNPGWKKYYLETQKEKN